ncbi:hypothetical protein CWATWH8502_1364 [Crocosphaera watsonii WH 8502]|uniref:Uncharacterized protein n=1 Tax=Crocosphaera watsonii WH 8502 TaxID=423474 RepID=T2IA94_CROWT|nr:hypothetical protein CWATWH8502_1364 [Crocosphaera watsonii WH 8502]
MFLPTNIFTEKMKLTGNNINTENVHLRKGYIFLINTISY